MTELQDGMTVFYIEDSEVFTGKVIDVEEMPGGRFEFSISSYGAYEGHYRISSGQIGKTVFFIGEAGKSTWLRV